MSAPGGRIVVAGEDAGSVVCASTRATEDDARRGEAPARLAAVTAADADPDARLRRALDLAYRYLGRRDRTVAEVRRHLEAKRCEPAAIDAAVAELADAGYLDDAGYARRFAEDRREIDGWGAERIARRLAALGVDDEHIAAACGARDHEDELEAALGILRRRFRTPPESDRERERALGMLVRKGYELELAYDAVRALER